jgi:hypothetical protein
MISDMISNPIKISELKLIAIINAIKKLSDNEKKLEKIIKSLILILKIFSLKITKTQIFSHPTHSFPNH